MKPWLAKIVLLVGSLALVFLIMEVGLRLSGYGTAGKREGNVVQHKVAEFDHTAVLNSLELRDREIGSKEEEECRILALGDSFTYGLGVDEPESFVRLTEDLLRERAGGPGSTTRYRIVNGGVGKGPHYQISWLQDVGLGLEPDFLVHTLFIGNDLYDDLRTRAEGTTERLPGDIAPGGARAAGRKSVFADWMWNRLVHVPVIDRMLFKAGYRYESGGLFLKQQPDLEREAWGLTLEGILQNVRLLEARGIGVLIVIVPTSDQVRYGADRPAEQDYMLPNRILTEFLAGHGIEYVDLLPLMEQEPERDAFYYVRDLHWTAAGHEFAARILSERLWGLVSVAAGPPSIGPPAG
jgi:hypothetical protein